LPSGEAIDAFVSQTEALEEFQTIFLWVQLGMSLVFDGIMEFIFRIINILQLVFVLPGIPINFPANVNFFYKALMPFVTFDILDPSYTTEYLFSFNQEGVDPYTDSLEVLGYETANLILNLGSIFIFLAIMIL
jgi:hypothetical protein